MSRAALWRQQTNVEERERRAEQIYGQVCEEGRSRSSSAAQRSSSSSALLPIWGEQQPQHDDRHRHRSSINDDDDPNSDHHASGSQQSTAATTTTLTFNFNPRLLKACTGNKYFQQRCCLELTSWTRVIDEIYEQVDHIQPFVTLDRQQQPSTAFCLLLRLCTLRMMEKELHQTLDHVDSPYIRAIGFLYLRYVGMPESVWHYIAPYVYDNEEFNERQQSGVLAAKQRNSAAATTTIGQFVRKLFASREYQTTPLPRYPIQVERSLGVQLLHADKVAERAAAHFQSRDRMEHFMQVGGTIQALYAEPADDAADSEEPNLPIWYRATIDRIIRHDEQTGLTLHHPKFVVTFVDYGNTETVHLGEIDLYDERDHPLNNGSSSRGGGRGSGDSDHGRGNTQDRDRHDDRRRDRRGGGGGGRDRRGNDDSYYDEIRRRERDTAATSSSSGWGRRPPTTKNSMASAAPSSSSRQHDYRGGGNRGDRGVGRHPNHERSRSKTPPAAAGNSASSQQQQSQQQQQQQQQPRKRTAQEMQEIAEKKRKLMAKYG